MKRGIPEIEHAMERCTECGNLLPPLPVDDRYDFACPVCMCCYPPGKARYYVDGQIICGGCAFCSCGHEGTCEYCEAVASKRQLEWLADNLRESTVIDPAVSTLAAIRDLCLETTGGGGPADNDSTAVVLARHILALYDGKKGMPG